jgi:hypothetical protein
VHVRFEGFETFEEGEHHETHTERGLVPIFRWYTESPWQGGGIKRVAHAAASSCLVSHISITKWMARQQKSAGCGPSLPLHTL